MSKDFWNLPVNPVWRVPGFMKGGKADNERSNPVLLPLVPEFTNICISHLQLLHFQKFLLEVVAIGRKNAGWESDNGKISLAWCGWGVQAIPFHSIYHHKQSFGVYTLRGQIHCPYFSYTYLCMYSVGTSSRLST